MNYRPNVVIFGGLDSIATIVIQYLVPRNEEPLAGHVLLVDKYSIHPPTTFVSQEFLSLCSNGEEMVEYKQANLQNPDVIREIFDQVAPNGRPYEYVFDFSGDLSYDRPSSVQIAHTLKVSLSIAQEASQRNIKAYIRVIGPFFNHRDLKKRYREEDAKGWKPWGKRGVWWLESIRAIGSIPNLPLVVLRCGAAYGPGILRLEVTSNILIGLVYKAMGQEMKFLWSPKLPKNTIHGYDLAAACWRAAEWISITGRATANVIAGVPVPTSGDKEVDTVPEALKRSHGHVLMPLFNVVDRTDTTQDSMAQVIGKVFGIKVGFHGNILSTISGIRMDDVAEDINELHMSQWAKLITTSSPPVPNTPLSPYAPAYILEEHGCAMAGDKIKKVLGLQLRYPRFDESAVREFIDWCRQEGIWPEAQQHYFPSIGL